MFSVRDIFKAHFTRTRAILVLFFFATRCVIIIFTRVKMFIAKQRTWFLVVLSVFCNMVFFF